MKVDGIDHNQLCWEVEYCRYYNINIIVYCNIDLRKKVGTLIKIKWVNESEDFFNEENESSTYLSRYINSEKILLAVTDVYERDKYPHYDYYTAEMNMTVERKDLNRNNESVIKNLIISTYKCVKPDNTRTLFISGRNIVPDELLSLYPDEVLSEVSFEFKKPEYVSVTEYYYNEDSNKFEKFDIYSNTKEKNVLMLDIDPLTLELLQKLDPRGRKLLNTKLSGMVFDTIKEVDNFIDLTEKPTGD